jgi:hypothetical protein
MPAFGLGKAGTLVEAKGELKSATDRFTDPDPKNLTI